MLLKPGSGGKELGVGGEFLSLISFTQNNKIKTKRSTSNLDKTPGVLWMTIVSLATKKKRKATSDRIRDSNLSRQQTNLQSSADNPKEFAKKFLKLKEHISPINYLDSPENFTTT